MAGQSKQATSATMALLYITVGALTVVWSVIYFIYLRRNDGSETAFLWCYGFFFSGWVLMFIGLALGRIGRAARQAEVAAQPPVQMVTPPPPQQVAAPTAAAAPVAAVAPQVVAPGVPTVAPQAPGVTPVRTTVP